MHTLIFRTLKRFYRRKLLHQIDLIPYHRSVPTTRSKVQVAMLDEEKILDTDMSQSELHSLSWLQRTAPCFPVNGSKITIIHEPGVFYSTLLEKCKHAKRRITFASLYLGTGKLESELVKVIQEAVSINGGNIEITILLDFMRGSRGEMNSCKMLEPLLNGKYGHCCKVFLYHTPKLRGLLKAVIPDRFNELIGLQHMKLYMIDDDIIISGANLSNDYFTNRQDRYFMIEDCKELCNFYNELVETVGQFSFSLQSNGTVKLSSSKNPHPFKDSRRKFVEKAANSIKVLFRKELEKRSEICDIGDDSETDTWIFPLIQMGQINICHDSQITLKLLQRAPPGSTLRLATSYFNLTSEYSNALLKHCQGTCHLLTAHPTANGFFSAKGVAGGIPAAYTKIEELFCKRCDKLGQQDRVILWEYVKPGWTYHAKGLWYSLPGQEKPSLTLIGSPNFGYRSVNRDLETQIALVSRNRKLQNAMHKEHERLFSCAQPVTRKTFLQQDRIPPTWVCAAVVLFRYYF